MVGKPSPHTVQVALERLNLPAGSAAMVGDRLGTDVLMARRGGLVGILTLSGVTRRDDLEGAGIRPDYVIESLAELPELDERLNG